jgi:hypothetical protein
VGYPTKFAGLFNAGEFAYGINKTTPALQVIGGPNTTVGAQALQLAFGYTQTNDGLVFNPLNTNAPITVGGNSSTETITPSAVSNSTPTVYSSSSLTGTFAYLHGNGDSIRSGTCGLQEALNYAGSIGGGTVIIDAGWVALGGTQAMLVAATVPANVGIWDNRYGADYSQFTTTLTSTQIFNMATTAVELLPAPNALAYWQVNSANLINLYATTSYTGGSAMTIGYGTTVATNALSGTVAAAFLTTPTSSEVIQVGSGLTTNVASTAVLGKGVYIANSTTAFAAGSGTLQVCLNAALVTV